MCRRISASRWRVLEVRAPERLKRTNKGPVKPRGRPHNELLATRVETVAELLGGSQTSAAAAGERGMLGDPVWVSLGSSGSSASQRPPLTLKLSE